MSDAGGGKYWFQGLPFVAATQTIQTGGGKYWLQGLPAFPLLNTTIPTPTPPGPGSSALPTGLRAARQDEDSWMPSFRRRFAPPAVVAPFLDEGSISIIW